MYFYIKAAILRGKVLKCKVTARVGTVQFSRVTLRRHCGSTEAALRKAAAILRQDLGNVKGIVANDA